MRKCDTHDVTLIAWSINDNGNRTIADIVETSFHYAYHFTRKWVKTPSVYAISAVKPGCDYLDMTFRVINR